MANNHEQLAAFLDGIHQLRSACSGLTDDQIRARPVPGRWSILEVVCHLADSEQAWCHRMKRVIAEPIPLLIGYDESRFTATLGYHDRRLDNELELFDRMRSQMGAILAGLEPAIWDRAGVHNERGLVTLAEMVAIEAEHAFHHIRHIEDKRRALARPPGS